MSPLPVAARRKVLGALAVIAGIAAAGRAALGQPAPSRSGAAHLRSVDDEYRRLLPLWQEERERFRASSNIYDSWSGPHGKAIVALGPAIIPHLIRELRKGDFFFNAPLALIAKVDIADGEFKSEQAKAALWLKWWDAAGGPAHP